MTSDGSIAFATSKGTTMFEQAKSALRRLRSLLQVARGRLCAHDTIYSDRYYERDVEPTTGRSAPLICETIVREYAPRDILDVGCGTGVMLAEFRRLGLQRLLGLEYSEAGLRRCAERGLEARKLDLESQSRTFDEQFDLAISMEVAEHLPARVADDYVDLLCRAAPIVAFTAAVPGQGGVDHVNEQPHEYWIRKFAYRGYRLEGSISERWRAAWRDSGHVAHWYWENIMVFRRTSVDGPGAPHRA